MIVKVFKFPKDAYNARKILAIKDPSTRDKIKNALGAQVDIGTSEGLHEYGRYLFEHVLGNTFPWKVIALTGNKLRKAYENDTDLSDFDKEKPAGAKRTLATDQTTLTGPKQQTTTEVPSKERNSSHLSAKKKRTAVKVAKKSSNEADKAAALSFG